jgi:DNA polymerase-3 subunit gamma/tau
MYQALYRKYRPRTFDDVAGQERITETLKSQVRGGRVSHAYLFIGTRGTGKTTCAKILARAVNCDHPADGNPCNECRSCRGIEDGSILDVVELDAASNNGVDNVRALRDEAVFSPAAVKKRVYIVDEVHMLSTAAFNALLKILEEPPEHLMFILATTELHKVPATILSRCQRHSFRRIGAGVVAERLGSVAEREGIDLTPEAGRLLGRLAEGSMRDGLALLDQCSASERVDTEAVLSAMGLAGGLRVMRLLEQIAAGQTDEALSLFQELWRDGKDPASLLSELSSLMRDILMLKVAPRGGAELISGAYDETVLRGVRVSREDLLEGINLLQSYLGRMREARSPRMLAELCLIELCAQPEPAVPAEPTPRKRVEPASPLPKQEAVRTDVSARETAPWPQPETERPAEPVPAAEMEQKPITPASAAEPEAEREPAVETRKESTVQRSAEKADFCWAKLLKELDGKLPIGICNLLSDEFQVNGAFNGGELVLRVNRGFAMNMLDTPDVRKKLLEGAAELCGEAVPVRMEEAGPPEAPDLGKLDKLGKFGNVTFQ